MSMNAIISCVYSAVFECYLEVKDDKLKFSTQVIQILHMFGHRIMHPFDTLHTISTNQ